MAASGCQFLFHCIKPLIPGPFSFSFSCKNAGYAQNIFGTMAHYAFFQRFCLPLLLIRPLNNHPFKDETSPIIFVDSNVLCVVT